MNLLNKTGLTYFWGKLKAYFVKGNGRVFFGTCDTASDTAAKVVTCPTFTSADVESGTILLVKFANANSASTSSITLNVNDTGAYGIRKIDCDAVSTLTYAGEIRAVTHQFVLNKPTGTNPPMWFAVGLDMNTNTTYSAMTQTQLTTGTSETGYRISPKLLRDNFYLKTEIPTFVHLTDESQMPVSPDSNTIYMIDVTTS